MVTFKEFWTNLTKDYEAVKKCLDFTDKSDFVDNNCNKYCEKFNFMQFTNFFDGNVGLLEKAYNNTINGVRGLGFVFTDRSNTAVKSKKSKKTKKMKLKE